MHVCIYTAIFGGYDDLKPQPPQSIPTDWVCFTDQPDRHMTPGWRTICSTPLRGQHPRIRAKYFKVFPHRVFRPPGLWGGVRHPWHPIYDVTIWMDGSIQLTSPLFAQTMLDGLQRSGLTMVVHPERDCIYDEAEACLPLRKCQGLPLREQVAHYRARGYPTHYGLMASGAIARHMAHPRVPRLQRAWWREICRWTYRDQLSLPVVLWQHRTWYDPLALNLWDNALFQVLPHHSDA